MIKLLAVIGSVSLSCTLVYAGINDRLIDLIALTPIEKRLAEYVSFAELFKTGRLCKVKGEPTMASLFLSAALSKNAYDPPTNWELGDIYLLLGDYAKGLTGFRMRWETDPRYQEKLWRGEDLTNKTILVHCQWGFGDTFMYIRLVTRLKELGAHIICAAQKPLVPLLKECSYIDQVIPLQESPLPMHDYQVPLTYLMDIFEITPETIPTPIPYIAVNPHVVKQWRTHLHQQDRNSSQNFTIGLCWQGAVRQDPQTANRPIKLTDLTPLFNLPNTTFYSLQTGFGTEQIAELPPTCTLHTFDESFDTIHGAFVDTAAVMKNLDLVITIDTSLAHLAGALGVPVWVLIPYANEWRYMLERTDSPWYPSMRLFRQYQPTDWSTVIENIGIALSSYIS